LINEVSKGDYKLITAYTYDGKGLFAKYKSNSVTDGAADPERTATFECEFRK
jgi:hypothetical protein